MGKKLYYTQMGQSICVSRRSKLIIITLGCFECTLTSLGSQYIRKANVINNYIRFANILRITHMMVLIYFIRKNEITLEVIKTSTPLLLLYKN